MTMYCPYCGTPLSDKLIERHEGLYSIWECRIVCPSASCRSITNLIDMGTATIEEISKLLDSDDPVIKRMREKNDQRTQDMYKTE